MLVSSIGYVKNSGVVAGVDTSKVQAVPVIKKVSKDFSVNSFTNNPALEPATEQNTGKNSVLGKFLNLIA